MAGDERKPGTPGTPYANWGVGIALGVAVGIAMGVALDNIGIGISLGAAFGIMAALLMAEMRKNQAEKKRDDDAG